MFHFNIEKNNKNIKIEIEFEVTEQIRVIMSTENALQAFSMKLLSTNSIGMLSLVKV